MLRHELNRHVHLHTSKLMDELPQTVQGMGAKLLAGHQRTTPGDRRHERKHQQTGNIAGFIAVQWILEPALVKEKINQGQTYRGPAFVDPLRRALDRVPKGLNLLSSPLVLDYVQVKFSCTLPKWNSRNPLQPTVNEGFYRYTGFDGADFSKIYSHSAHEHEENQANSRAKDERFMSRNFLLRWLQGWDHENHDRKWNIPLGTPRTKQHQRRIPHTTILPGLQFRMAGVLGKPAIFYRVPVMRFEFEILIYLVMLVLFSSSLLLKKHDVVPPDEVIFYFFTSALLWREVSEFRDGISPLPASMGSHSALGNTHSIRDCPQDIRQGRVFSALTRYAFHDTWNFLDTTTIACILVAFVLRMLALKDEALLFHAQFFYALGAPLLFSRLLVLAQIDSTLGPMTKVIWRLMSHTLRFSAYIATVMLSFALAFHAVFHTCATSESEGGVDCASNPLGDAFGTFGDSLVTVFSSALGGPDFGSFDASDCRCNLPDGALPAGILLMVVYMITMGVVLLNLLIAVLSTAHDQVYANAEKKFHMARARLIYQSARVVKRCRPPPPLNLVQAFFGLLLDAGNEVFPLFHEEDSGERGRVGDAGTSASTNKDWKPASETSKWQAIEGGIQRFVFACTFGAFTLVALSVLWILSVPSITWFLQQFVLSMILKKDGKCTGNAEAQGVSKHDSRYFRRLLNSIVSLASLVGLSVFAVALCLLQILLSVFMWVVGICHIFEWVRGELKRKGGIPDAMPGQDHGRNWDNALSFVRLQNHGVREDRSEAHFHVVPFLKSKTGLDMQHLVCIIKARDAKSKSRQELADADRKLPDARIGFDNLVERIKQRRKEGTAHDGRGGAEHSDSGARCGGGLNGGGDGSSGDGGGGAEIKHGKSQADSGPSMTRPESGEDTSGPNPGSHATGKSKARTSAAREGGEGRVRHTNGSRSAGNAIDQSESIRKDEHDGESRVKEGNGMSEEERDNQSPNISSPKTLHSE